MCHRLKDLWRPERGIPLNHGCDIAGDINHTSKKSMRCAGCNLIQTADASGLFTGSVCTFRVCYICVHNLELFYITLPIYTLSFLSFLSSCSYFTISLFWWSHCFPVIPPSKIILLCRNVFFWAVKHLFLSHCIHQSLLIFKYLNCMLTGPGRWSMQRLPRYGL